MFRRHVDLIEQLKKGPRTLHEVRKACAWYARGLYGCNSLRLRVWETTDLATSRALVEDYFNQLIERQSRLGLSPEMSGSRDDGEMDGTFNAGSEEGRAELIDSPPRPEAGNHPAARPPFVGAA